MVTLLLASILILAQQPYGGYTEQHGMGPQDLKVNVYKGDSSSDIGKAKSDRAIQAAPIKNRTDCMTTSDSGNERRNREAFPDQVNLAPGIAPGANGGSAQDPPEGTQSSNGGTDANAGSKGDRPDVLDGINLGPATNGTKAPEAYQGPPEHTRSDTEQPVGNIPDQKERDAILDKVNRGPRIDKSLGN